MRRFTFLFLFLVLGIKLACAQTAVSAHGQLSVSGSRIVDKNGDNVSLSGMSLFWSNNGWGGEKYYNADVINWLQIDWGVTVVRAAMGVEADGGYISKPADNKAKVKAVVDAAIAKGMYVIIDWHSHDAPAHKTEAIAFFKEMATTYGSYPNIIYEIFNEPLQVSWSQNIKPYAIDVIKEIRAIDSKNIIVVGTPAWSQDVDVASNDKITGYDNIAYTLHFYAATHKDYFIQKAKTAMNNGIALIVTEWGTCEASGAGNIDQTSVTNWLNFIKDYSLTFCNWSVNDKKEYQSNGQTLIETASVLEPGASTAGNWTASNLTPSGVLVKNIIKTWEGNAVSGDLAPTFASAATSTDGLSITIVASKALAAIAVNEVSKFSVTSGSTAVTVSSVKLDNANSKQIILTLSSAITAGARVFVSYSGTGITNTNNQALVNFTSQSVANRVSGGNSVICDFTKGAVTITGTKWYSYNDADNGGKSSVSPNPFHATVLGYGNVDSAASISYSLDKGSLDWDPTVGMGFSFAANNANFDLTGSTGVSFKYKGNASTLEVGLSTVTNYQYHSYSIPASSDWTTVTVNWNDTKFAQPAWDKGVLVNWDPSKVTKMQWKVSGATGDKGTVWVDDVTINNVTILGPSLSVTTLQAAITEASGLISTAKIGTGVGQVAQADLDALKAAVSTAGGVVISATTQTEVDNASKTLNAAIATYKTKIVKPNVTELSAKIAEAQTLVNSATEGTKLNQYQAGAKAAYQTAINKATSTMNTATTQEAVNNALTDLNAATTAFNAKKITKTALSDYASLTLNIYPNPTVATVRVESDVEIQNIEVQSVVSGLNTRLQSSQNELDFSTLAPGVYLVKVSFADDSSITRLVTKR